MHFFRFWGHNTYGYFLFPTACLFFYENVDQNPLRYATPISQKINILVAYLTWENIQNGKNCKKWKI